MKRRHTRAQAVAAVARAKALRPGLAVGADIITGFPTEDEAAFANTLAAVDDCDIAFAHVFPYSERDGTPAARIPTDRQVPVTVRKDRAARLRAAGARRLGRLLDAMVGTTQSVLIENETMGRTPNFAPVAFDRPMTAGTMVDARIVASDGKMLHGAL